MRRKTTITFGIATCLIPLLATAGSTDAVPAQAKELHCLVGKWKGEGKLTVGSEVASVKGKYVCKKISGGFGVACTAELTGVPGLDKYRQHDMWGYDAGADAYHWFAITNAGETHDHVGRLTSDSFVGKYEGVRGGKAFVETVEFRFTDDDTLRVISGVREDGKLAEKLELVFRR